MQGESFRWKEYWKKDSGEIKLDRIENREAITEYLKLFL